MSSNLPFHAILFDLDGTLVDSIHDIAQAANAMLTELNFEPYPLKQMTSFVGRGVDALVWQCLLGRISDNAPEPALYQKARTLFAKHYDKVLHTGETPIFNEVFKGLEAFKAAGCPLAVVTNKPLAYTQIILTQTQLAPLFDYVVGGDSCEEKKPDPLPLLYACAQLDVPAEKCLMVGDSINDVQAARQANMKVIVVPYGYRRGQSVEELQADAVVPSIWQAYVWAKNQ